VAVPGKVVGVRVGGGSVGGYWRGVGRGFGFSEDCCVGISFRGFSTESNMDTELTVSFYLPIMTFDDFTKVRPSGEVF
jgi:hypothetical protein